MKKALIIGIIFALSFSICGCSFSSTPQQSPECQHNIVIDKAVPPSCYTSGLTEGSHCLVCEEVIVEQQPVAALGHTTSVGTCDRCGESFGEWTTKYYVDEFNDPTAQKYITTKSMIHGTFSNTATTNSKLTAKILVDSVDISFMLYEYGSYQVKSGITYEYRISIKYGYSKETIYGKLYTDRISVYGRADKETLLTALSSGETVSFYIEDTKYKTSNYLFSVESSNFANEYAKSILGKDGVDNTETPPNSTTPETEPVTETEQIYRDAQICAFEFKYDEAVALLRTIPDYKNAAQAIALLEKPLAAVFSYTDGGTVHYLWAREKVWFSGLGYLEDYETPYSSYTAYKWFEVPSIGSHGTPTLIYSTDICNEETFIMSYYYKWNITDNGKTIVQNEIDQDSNEKGEYYRVVWRQLPSDEQDAAIARLTSYLQES